MRIVVASSHYLHAPSEIALLDTHGRLVREYWHYGQLNHLALADLDGDGASEIYAAGISNTWSAATVVVLDPETFGGASAEPEHPDEQLLGFDNAREMMRIVLPRTCLNREHHPYNAVGQLYAKDGVVTVATIELFNVAGGPLASVIHHFRNEFAAHHVDLSDSYATEYRKAARPPNGCPVDDPRLREIRVLTPSRRHSS
jgi:hypothetical protein